MIKTPLLELPIYNDPANDNFNLADWNKANGNLEYAYKDIKTIAQEIASTNATAEVIQARLGKPTLADQMYTFNDLISILQSLKMDKDYTNISISQINKNLGKIDATYLADSVLSMITGGTPVNATPADNSLTTAKYIDNSVTVDKLAHTTGIIYGRNIINVKTATKEVEVLAITNAITPNGTVGVINAGTYLYLDAYNLAGGNMVYGFVNPVTKGLEFYKNKSAPSGLIFVFSIHRDTTTGNEFAIKVNNVPKIIATNSEVVVDRTNVVPNSLTIDTLAHVQGTMFGKNLVNINSSTKVVEVKLNVYVATQNGTMTRLLSGNYDFSDVFNSAGGYMIYAFLNPTGILEFHKNKLAPNGYIFLFAYYNNAICGNEACITVDNKPSTVSTYEEIIIDGQQIKSNTLALLNINGATMASENLVSTYNLYDGFYVSFSTGKILPNPVFFVTGFLPVKPNTKYTISNQNQLAFYDKNSTYLSGIGNDAGNIGVYTFTTPPNCCYVRTCGLIESQKNNFRLCEGESLTNVVAHRVKFNDAIITDNELVNGIDGKKIKQITQSRNLFNKYDDGIIKGKYAGYGGTLGTNPNYYATDFIPIEEETVYTISYKDQISFYDINKNYISGIGSANLSAPFTFTTPKGARFIRISIYATKFETFQFEKGDAVSTFQEYGMGFSKEFKPSILNFKEVEKNPNLFNKEDIYKDKKLFSSANNVTGVLTGNLVDDVTFSTSVYMEVIPNNVYARSKPCRVAFYNNKFKFVSGINEFDTNLAFTVPATAFYIRVSLSNDDLDIFQLEKGSTVSLYNEYGKFNIKGLLGVGNATENNKPFITLREAYFSWENGEKCPIGFLSDSTCDGANTSDYISYGGGHQKWDDANGGLGKVEYINDKAYPRVLEKLIQEETKSLVPRVYNIAYSGTTTAWAIPRLNDLFGGCYSDVKLVGLGHGINDRLGCKTTKEYYEKLYSNYIVIINFLKNRGIQPFFVTNQATAEAGVMSIYTTEHPLRTSEDISSVANSVKRKLANEYNLEMLDLTTIGQMILEHSLFTAKEIISDKLHFGDIGHNIEGGDIFAQLCPRTIEITKKEPFIIGITNQNVRCRNIASEKTTFLDARVRGFSLSANYTKADNADMYLMDIWIRNISKDRLNIYSEMNTPNGNCYVLVNGVKTVLTSATQKIATLEIGTHHIQAFTGNTNIVDFLGFKID